MNINMIFGSDITLETMYRLNEMGLQFVIEDGVVTEVIC